METKTIIYLVAAALILRVIIKVIFKFTKEVRASNKSGHGENS